jgi:hypothetical protein
MPHILRNKVRFEQNIKRKYLAYSAQISKFNSHMEQTEIKTYNDKNYFAKGFQDGG